MIYLSKGGGADADSEHTWIRPVIGVVEKLSIAYHCQKIFVSA